MPHSQMPESSFAPPRKPILHSLELTPFIDALPLPSRATLIAPHKHRIGMREVRVKVHRDVPPHTPLGLL